MCPTPQTAASPATPTFYPTANTLCLTAAAPTTLTVFLQPTELHQSITAQFHDAGRMAIHLALYYPFGEEVQSTVGFLNPSKMQRRNIIISKCAQKHFVEDQED